MAKRSLNDIVYIRIVNGKQPQTIRLKGGYLNLLPREEVRIPESSMTDDIRSKSNRGILKFFEEAITAPVVEKSVEKVVEKPVEKVVEKKAEK